MSLNYKTTTQTRLKTSREELLTWPNGTPPIHSTSFSLQNVPEYPRHLGEQTVLQNIPLSFNANFKWYFSKRGREKSTRTRIISVKTLSYSFKLLRFYDSKWFSLRECSWQTSLVCIYINLRLFLDGLFGTDEQTQFLSSVNVKCAWVDLKRFRHYVRMDFHCETSDSEWIIGSKTATTLRYFCTALFYVLQEWQNNIVIYCNYGNCFKRLKYSRVVWY